MRQAVIAVISAVVALYPGYLLGKRVRDNRRWYLALFWGTLALMVAAVTWSLIAGRSDIAAAALGVAFGLINGVRHGFSPVFSPLLHPAGDEENEQY